MKINVKRCGCGAGIASLLIVCSTIVGCADAGKSTVGCADAGKSTFRIVSEGSKERVVPAPPQVVASTQPFAKNIPLTIADDKQAAELVVLTPGAEVVASTPNGTVRITYLAPDRRRIEWTDNLNEGTGRTYSQEVHLYPRGVWYSVSGKYSRDPFPAQDVRILYGEGQLRARSLADALKPLQIAPGMCYVANEQGLVVGYWPTLSRNDLQLALIQVYVDDAKASGLFLGKGAVSLVHK